MHGDHLGSTRLVTDLNKNVVQNLDYFPGACPERSRRSEINSTDSGITTHKFTGDERDSETSLDHTWFRQYSSQFARWTSPDPAGLAAVDPSNPQSWNRYAYVGNNPMNFLDPSGLYQCPTAPLYDGSCGGAGSPGGPTCIEDGVDVGCNQVSRDLGSGVAVQCPNNICSGVNGNGQFLAFKAFADGSSGYLPFNAPPGYSVADIASALSTVSTAANATRLDPSQLPGQASIVYGLLITLGVSPGNISIYQNGTESFAAVLTGTGFDQLQQALGVDSNWGDAFLHYPYTDGGRSDQTPFSLHYVWFDQNLTDYVGGNGVYMQFHSDSSNPYNGAFWQHWGCDVLHLTCN